MSALDRKAICKTCSQTFDLAEAHDCPGLIAASPKGQVEAVADALEASFKRAIEASSGKTFIDSKVALPARDIWFRYATDALAALSPAPAGGWQLVAFMDEDGTVLVPEGSPIAGFMKMLPEAQIGRKLLPLYATASSKAEGR
jgi:hypothetical protein